MRDITCGGCKFLGMNKEQYKLNFANGISYTMRNDKIVCNKSGLTVADYCERSDKCMNENWKEVI